VVVDDRRDPAAEPVDEERWVRLAGDVLRSEGVAGTEVAVTFVDEDTIAALKQEHLQGDGRPTDVLAFPMDEPHATNDGPHDGAPDDGHVPRLLGDVVICPAVAARQAPSHAGSYDDEVALLLVHGLLHLLGMDHADDHDRGLMQRRERELLAAHHGTLAGDPWAADPTEVAS
jgi:probable rRNA maturation factor